jgi:hypothetical protein
MNHLIVKVQTPSDCIIRNTVMYSMRAREWAETKAQPLYQLDKSR